MAIKWDYCRLEVVKLWTGTCLCISPPRDWSPELFAEVKLKPLADLDGGRRCAPMGKDVSDADYDVFWWGAVDALLSRGWEPFQSDVRGESSNSRSMHFRRLVAGDSYLAQLGLTK